MRHQYREDPYDEPRSEGALQDPALEARHGRGENLAAGQRAF